MEGIVRVSFETTPEELDIISYARPFRIVAQGANNVDNGQPT
jgi:hypothetical protein